MLTAFGKSHVEGRSRLLILGGSAAAWNRARDTGLAVLSDLQAEPQPVSVWRFAESGQMLGWCPVLKSRLKLTVHHSGRYEAVKKAARDTSYTTSRDGRTDKVLGKETRV